MTTTRPAAMHNTPDFLHDLPADKLAARPGLSSAMVRLGVVGSVVVGLLLYLLFF